MLQVARLAPNQLGEAADRVVEFLQEQFNPDGGVQDRSGNSDLYYTVFGLQALSALRAEPPVDRVGSFLRSFGDGEGLDLVHLACLARCCASVPGFELDPTTATTILDRIESFRLGDGGYGPEPDAQAGTIYHGFLALGAYQDLQRELPDADRLADWTVGLRTPDGAFANSPGMPQGTTPTTAAAVALLRQLQRPEPAGTGEWLLACGGKHGGFVASPVTPLPDLLSTATALHALEGLQVSFESLREPCLDFVDSLWTGRGFCGHWADDAVDAEYTFYGLLALGHLSV